MASLSSAAKLGNTSASSLIRSSQSIQSSINTYQDGLASYTYDLSSKTDGDLAQYQDYLTSRINQLQSTGSVTDANKALSLARTLTTATRSNVSANISRENIDVMSGNGTLQDKYSTIVDQFTRATAIGDSALAQQLEGQAYSVSQSIQYQAQQAQQAGAALATATTNAKISEQGNIVTSLDDSVKQLNNDISNLGVKDLNQTVSKWVSTNKGVLQSLGVIIPDGAQPNYFDLLQGVQNAKYNSLILKSQAQATTNPGASQNTANEAALLSQGATKIQTLGGSLTIQEINQAAQDPSMFAYDNSNGKYVRTAQVGYQYLNGQLAPQYSGIVGDKARNATSEAVNGNSVKTVFLLNPNQTAELSGLGLNFKANSNNTTGDGVEVQATANTPGWLRNVIGKNGLTNTFTDSAGNLQFEGSATSGQGMSYYSLINVGGLSGIFEHFADGSSKLAGGNYGFDAGAAQLLVNMGQQKQQQIQLQTKAALQAQQAALKISPVPQLPQVQVAPPINKTVNPTTVNPQKTVSTQSIQPTVNAQSLQPTVGASLNQSGSGGIKLSQPSVTGIRL